MRNKFLKGLSVAFAAAMAFTVVAPALTTEAASAKAYVVTKKTLGFGTGNNKVTTEYTYDSRGRVIKEVTTNTNGGGTTLTGRATQGAPQTVETTVKVNGTITSYTAVAATSFDYEVAKLTNDVKTVTTTNYTYYNSGAKKDQKKSANTTIEEKQTVAYASNVEGASYAFAKGRISTAETVYTYDSKGNKIQEVTTEKGTGLVNAADPRNAAPKFYYASIQNNETPATIEGTANQRLAAVVEAANSDDNMKDYYIIENKQVFTNDSKGQAVSVAQTFTAGAHNYIQATDTSVDTVRVAEGAGQFSYNKNGFPTKFVKTNYNKLTTSVINGATNVVDQADTVETYTYKYGKDLQLASKTKVTKNPIAQAVLTYVKNDGTAFNAQEQAAMNIQSGVKTNAVAGTVQTTQVGKDDINQATGVPTTLANASIALVTNYVYDSDSTDTYKYNYDLKDGSTAKTYELRFKDNGTTSDEIVETKYDVKKISVPSSRATGVMKEQFLAQTDFDW